MTKHFPNFFLCEMNNCYVTYLIGPHINDRLSINCNTFDIVIKCNYSQAVVVLMGRPMCGVMSIAP